MQAKQSIRQLNDAIKTLGVAEQARQAAQSQVALKKRAKQGLGALGRWAAGGAITAKSPEEEIEEAKANTIKAHRESIIWSLQKQLEECGQFQSNMMEIRLTREVEKSKSVLHKTRITAPVMADYDPAKGGQGAEADYRGTASYSADEGSTVIENQLDPEQLQLFAQENQDMLKQYEDQLDKIRYVAVVYARDYASANAPAAQRKNHSPRSLSCSRRWRAISACRQRTLTSWSRTRSTRRKTWGAATRS